MIFILISCGDNEEKDEPSYEEHKTTTVTVNGVSFTMVKIEGGTFTMGATPEQPTYALEKSNEKPAHEVSLSSYCIGQTEVTQALWQAVTGNNPYDNPSYFTGDLNRPVECVSWENCQEFIKRLNQITGKTFRLPTEAEWEFAARGGNKKQGFVYAGSNSIGSVAWYKNNAYDVGSHSPDYGTHTVASKAPNELGLYDMSGNVAEYVQDYSGEYGLLAETNPKGPSTGYFHIVRGGSWDDQDSECRVSRRVSKNPKECGWRTGLRLAL